MCQPPQCDHYPLHAYVKKEGVDSDYLAIKNKVLQASSASRCCLAVVAL